MPQRLDPDIVTALEETGIDYTVERGTRHVHIRLAGRLVGTVGVKSRSADRRAVLNVRAQIRRAAKEMT